jgi:hypothetical protein
MQTRIFTLMILIAALLCGCLTMDATRLSDLSIRQTPRPLTLLPGYDVYMVREDLVRATHSQTQTTYVNGQASTQIVQVPNAYSELVIDFGNGIIMDYNYNLCVDLLRFYDMQDMACFAITKEPRGFTFEAEKYYKLEDGLFESSFETGRRASFKENRIEIESGMLKLKRFVEEKDDEVVFWGKFLGEDINKSAKLTNAETLEVKGFWRDKTFTMDSPDRIAMGKYFKIETDNDHITITYTGIFGLSTVRTFFRTENGFIFFDQMNRGIEVIREGNCILVKRGGMLKAEYRINTE